MRQGSWVCTPAGGWVSLLSNFQSSPDCFHSVVSITRFTEQEHHLPFLVKAIMGSSSVVSLLMSIQIFHGCWTTGPYWTYIWTRWKESLSTWEHGELNLNLIRQQHVLSCSGISNSSCSTCREQYKQSSYDVQKLLQLYLGKQVKAKQQSNKQQATNDIKPQSLATVCCCCNKWDLIHHTW